MPNPAERWRSSYRCAFQLALLPFLLTACVWPLPIGPGPVTVVTEDVRIATVPEEMLFGSTGGATPPRMVEVVQWDITSETDFHRHFKDRFMQVRCTVDGNADHAWSDFGHGPFYKGVDLSRSSVDGGDRALLPRARDGRYAYTVYAFAGLSAGWLEDGHLSRRTDLESVHFSRLSCFIIGVAMAPVLFPKSNEFVLSHDRFIALRSARKAAATNCASASPACPTAHEGP
jgi:hypothetical protein